MKTDDLIAELSTSPVQLRPPAMVLAGGIGAGAAISIALMLFWLHPRPDLAAAVWTAPFWMKLGYAAILAGLAAFLVIRLSRPTGTAARRDLVLLLPVLVLAILAVAQLWGAMPAERMHLMMGASWNVCPWRIAALSLPVLAGGVLSLRTLAPTELTVAGTAAGLLAGAAGAFIYAFHCDESAAPFVMIWYTFGMALTALLGAILGRSLLRW